MEVSAEAANHSKSEDKSEDKTDASECRTAEAVKDKTTEVGDSKTEVSTLNVKSEDKTVVVEFVDPAEAKKLRQSEDKTTQAEDRDSVAEENTISSSESVSEDIDNP